MSIAAQSLSCALLLLLSAAAQAQSTAGLLSLPVIHQSGQTGPVPDHAAAQLVPLNRRPSPAAPATAHMPTPEESRVAGQLVGTPLPDATNLPRPENSRPSQ